MCSDRTIKPRPVPLLCWQIHRRLAVPVPTSRLWVHCPRASDGLLPPRLNLVGYVRWDARSDLITSLSDNHVQQLTDRTVRKVCQICEDHRLTKGAVLTHGPSVHRLSNQLRTRLAIDKECADSVRAPGSNRHVVGNERVLQERSSEPSCPRVLRGSSRGGRRSVNRGISGQGIELRKLELRGADPVHTRGRQHRQRRFSRVSVATPRSRRPQAR